MVGLWWVEGQVLKQLNCTPTHRPNNSSSQVESSSTKISKAELHSACGLMKLFAFSNQSTTTCNSTTQLHITLVPWPDTTTIRPSTTLGPRTMIDDDENLQRGVIQMRSWYSQSLRQSRLATSATSHSRLELLALMKLNLPSLYVARSGDERNPRVVLGRSVNYVYDRATAEGSNNHCSGCQLALRTQRQERWDRGK